MSALFSPVDLGGMTVSNRIVVSPMCQYVAVNGAATSWHLIHLGGLALSGAGTLCIEATAVEPEGRITPGCLGLWDEATAAALEPAIDAVRQYSTARLVMQLAHAGRKGSSRIPWEGGQLIPIHAGGWEMVAPCHRAEGRRAAANLARSPPQRGARIAWESTGSRFMQRTATCSTSSCRRSPTAAPTNMVGRSRIACAIR